YDFEDVFEKTKEKLECRYETFFNKVNVHDAIGDIPKPTGDGNVKLKTPNSAYQNMLRSDDGIVTNHIQTKHSKKAIDRMKKIKPGENYKALKETVKSVHSGSY